MSSVDTIRFSTTLNRRWSPDAYIQLTPESFTLDADLENFKILINYLKNPATAQVPWEDGKARVDACLSHLKKYGTFPYPVVLEKKVPHGYWVLDGNHRLAAYFYLRYEVSSGGVAEKQMAWVGFPTLK